MKVLIQHEDEHAEQPEVSINDEFFDVTGWVNLHVGGSVAEVHIQDLYRACLPFLDSYERERNAD